MREELAKTAKRYSEVQDRIADVEEEIDELRQQTFGDESEHTEEKARELFNEVSSTENDSSKADQLDDLREEETQLKKQLTELENDLLEKLVNVRFPLEETIHGDESPIEFPFSESVEPAVLDAISTALGDDIREGKVKIQSESMTVETDSVEKAIDAVKNRVSDIRKQADANLEVPTQVQKLRDRDEKVPALLYVLNENGESPMSKAEIEDAIGLERGDLRGQLYYVKDNDPFLTKGEEGFQLTANGRKVITRYVDKYEVPSLISNKGAAEHTEEDNAPEEEEVVTHE